MHFIFVVNIFKIIVIILIVPEASLNVVLCITSYSEVYSVYMCNPGRIEYHYIFYIR